MKYPYSVVKGSFHSQEPWINVLFLKYITLPLVYLMVNYSKLTPNHISLFSICTGLISAYCYLSGQVILGGVMYFISYIFDATDGKVARITSTGKPYGAWLDICIDRINLILISTAISYNSFIQTDNILIVVLNSVFLGLAFLGWESRYNIDIFKIKNNFTEENIIASNSRYGKWCQQKGLDKLPISLPELFLFYLIISPYFKIELITIIIISFFLILRIIIQQKFWIHVINR